MLCCRRLKISDGSQSSYLNIMHPQRKHNDSQTEQKKLEIHNQLLEYVKANDIENIRHLINEHNELLTMKYPHPYFKSIIPIARFNFFRSIDMKTMKTLIQLGFQINNASNRIDELIFFAAASGHKDKLKEVLDYIRVNCSEILNNTREGDTALMFLIKYGDPTTPEFVECVKILIHANIDVNIPDYNNCSPIVRAAYLYHTHEKKPKSVENDLFLESFREVVKIVLHKGNVDLDSHKWYEKTAREYITLNQICQIPKQAKMKGSKHINIKSKLFSLVIAKADKKIVNIKKVKNYNLDDGENTLLQLAVQLKLETAVKYFLKRGADPNSTTARNRDTPLEMAAKRNHHKIFEILLQWQTTAITSEIYCHFAAHRGNKIKEKYFIELLHSPKLNIDLVCKCDNTPLHYAAMLSENEIVLDLLKRGASLVVENKFGEKPIDYIDPRVMTKFIDHCVESKSSVSVYHKKAILTFNYQFLLKNQREPTMESSFEEIEDIADNFIQKERFASETEVAMTISELPEMRNLLKHPVISSFLYVKWFKIKNFFWIVMLFHVWCYLSFLNYFYYCSRYDYSQIQATFWIFILSYVAYVGFILTRIIVNRGDLNMHLHIYIECCLVILILITLCLPSMVLRKHFSVFGILLAAFSLIFWMGYHPKMSTHVAMLQRVAYNFFKILLCYCILIIAFGISFYILFHNYQIVRLKKNGTEIIIANDTMEDENSFFINPGTAIFKTFVMMTGEYETSEFKFHQTEASSYIIFLLFVFMISLILMNLLTGVAVTDTETIQNEAEIVGHISTIRFIRFIEVVLQPSFYPKALYKTKFNVNNCFISPHLFDNKLSFYPNMRGKVRCDHSSSPLRNLRLRKHLCKTAMNIIIKREIRLNRFLGNENFIAAEDLKLFQSKIDEIAEKQKVFFNKFQESIDQISSNLNMITSNFEIVTE